MGNIHPEPSANRRYPDRHYLGSIPAIQTMLEQYSIRGTKPNQLLGTLQMTKCLCENMTDPLVMTRELFADTVRFNRNNQRFETLDEVINLLNKHRELWFWLSISTMNQGYWRNKTQAIDLLLTELEEMKCQ
jgi:hypothetical protein